mgnify:CR=1 FL=1
MEKLLRKFHSQRGETMLMALLLFLVGVMVSAVILAAAISAESDAKAAREEQQAYLTVSSAAELFRDAIQSGNSGGYREIVTKTYSDAQLQGTKTEKQNASGPFSEIFNNVIPTLLTSPTTFRKTYTLSMDGLEDVTMELSIQPKQGDNDQFTLTAVFYNDPEGDHPCRMTVTFTGETTQTPTDWYDSGLRYEATTTEIKWTGATITRPRTQTGG